MDIEFEHYKNLSAFPHSDDTGGLTKREYMAAKICAGLCAGNFEGDAANSAVKIADRLLAELHALG